MDQVFLGSDGGTGVGRWLGVKNFSPLGPESEFTVLVFFAAWVGCYRSCVYVISLSSVAWLSCIISLVGVGTYV